MSYRDRYAKQHAKRAEQHAKRDAIETAIRLFGWPVMYQSLRDKGWTDALSWRSEYAEGHRQICSLRPDHPPTVPGWKLAVYDILFGDDDAPPMG